MTLALHPNDTAREAKPSLWIFSGSSIGWLVVGVMFFIVIFRLLAAVDVDWWIAGLIALMPLAAITLFVHLLVNARPPSYATDLLFWLVWRMKARLYLAGWLDRAPLLWVEGKTPIHPKEFS